MKPHLLHLLLFSLILATVPFSIAGAQDKRGAGVQTVVIDPGHGGKDPGCVRNGVREKDVNLRVALKFGKMIADNLPDVKVVYTRKTDVFVPLAERGNIANKAGADLFISIHADAVEKNTVVSGSSTFVMGNDKSQANLQVAMRENDVVSYEEDYSAKYEGYVPGSAESYIIFSLMQYAYRDQSMNFAELVQRHYGKNIPMKNRGAREAPYLVLWRTAMPSVLTEMGFLSNPDDRRFLTSAAGQTKVARALFNAFSEYKAKVEGNTRIVSLPPEGGERETHVADAVPEKRTEANGKPAAGQGGSISRNKERGLEFMVQVSAVSKRADVRSRSIFGAYAGKVVEKRVGKLYKYYLGPADSYAEALSLQREARSRFRDAFIVAFREGRQVPLTDEMKR